MASPAPTAVDLRKTLALPISVLDLSLRASNCLEAEGIQTIGELVRRSEDEMVKLKNFGKTSFKEVEKKLSTLDLKFGMDVEAVLGERKD